MARPITFVVYDQGSPRTSRENRQKIASHIGKHYRNRSAPVRNSLKTNAKCQKSALYASSCHSLPIILRSAAIAGDIDKIDRPSLPKKIKQKLQMSEQGDEQHKMYAIYPSLQQWILFPYPESHQASAKFAFEIG